MPNTLAHVGIQGPATRLLLPDADLRWILTGAILPDLPWIGQRVAAPFLDGGGLVTLKAYAIVQASLAWCLILAAAAALLTARPWRVFAVLAFNALAHLLLDATEGLWGINVHLLAPFDWRSLDWGLYWPESAFEVLLTLGGLAFVVLEWPRRGSTRSRQPSQPLDLRSPRRLGVSAVLVLVYFASPFAFLEGPLEADAHAVRTLASREGRAGRTIELDSTPYRRGAHGDSIVVFTGEEIAVRGVRLDRSDDVSLRGRFVDDDTLEIVELHAHSLVARDAGSYVGILLAALLWLVGLRSRGG